MSRHSPAAVSKFGTRLGLWRLRMLCSAPKVSFHASRCSVHSAPQAQCALHVISYTSGRAGKLTKRSPQNSNAGGLSACDTPRFGSTSLERLWPGYMWIVVISCGLCPWRTFVAAVIGLGAQDSLSTCVIRPQRRLPSRRCGGPQELQECTELRSHTYIISRGARSLLTARTRLNLVAGRKRPARGVFAPAGV